jgi:hypothetical protein
MFTNAAIEIFLEFPLEACYAVGSPSRGLPSRLKFPPTLADIREALVEAQKPIAAKLERNRIAAAQIAARKADPTWNVEEPLEVRKAAVEKWEAMRDEVLGKVNAEQAAIEAEETLTRYAKTVDSRKPMNVFKTQHMVDFINHMAAGGSSREFHQGYKPGELDGKED